MHTALGLTRPFFFLSLSFFFALLLASPAQDAEGCTIDIKITDKGDGTFHCVYTPVKSIKHTIIITWGEVNVPNSPFRVRRWQLLPAASLMRFSAEFSAPLTSRGVGSAAFSIAVCGVWPQVRRVCACVLTRCWLARALTQTESRSTGPEWRRRDSRLTSPRTSRWTAAKPAKVRRVHGRPRQRSS